MSGASAAQPRGSKRRAFPGLVLLLAAAGFAVLGGWQVQRLFWKTRLLAELAEQERLPPGALDADTPTLRKVSVTGIFPGQESFRYGVEARELDGLLTMGSDLVSVLRRPGLPPVLADRGWMPDDAPEPAAGPATVIGFVLMPERRGFFTAPDDIARRRLYALDPARLAAEYPGLLPLAVVAVGPAAGVDGPQPLPTFPRPPNDHLGYAVTWLGLAAVTLLGGARAIRGSRPPS